MIKQVETQKNVADILKTKCSAFFPFAYVLHTYITCLLDSPFLNSLLSLPFDDAKKKIKRDRGYPFM